VLITTLKVTGTVLMESDSVISMGYVPTSLYETLLIVSMVPLRVNRYGFRVKS
jgi:hypothetical protein